MHKLIVAMVFLIFIVNAVASTSDKAMPLSKENVIACALRMKHAIEGVTPQEQRMMRGDMAFSKKIISHMVVQPITGAGYGFDETVLAITSAVSSGNLPLDPDHKAALLFVLTSIYGSSNHLVSYGLMSQSTKVALEEAVARVVKS